MQMSSRISIASFLRSSSLLIAGAFSLYAPGAKAQVSPEEIASPDLSALEKEYFPQLKSLNQSIARAQFPFPFYLSRYVGLDPAQQAESDSRGLEFVRFHDRVLLKITGNYNAAYDSSRLSRNERAGRTFHDVVLPVLQIVTAGLPEDLHCDGIGFEISYHSRSRDKNYDYEGKEIVVVTLDRADAWSLARAANDAERQEILNRSLVYLNGAEFGLSLSERDPLNVASLPRSVPQKIDATSTARSSVEMSHLARTNSKLVPQHAQSELVTPSSTTSVPSQETSSTTVSTQDAPKESTPVPPAPTQADADKLGEKYQSALAALQKEGVAKFHFVDYGPPGFVVFRKQIALQMTLRNSLHFAPQSGSIYKRAAQSFDLFLAPLLKDLLEKVPEDMNFQVYDFSVLNKLAPGPKGTEEAVEFICPRSALRQFVDAEITNQQLLDQSVVLVNGVRIALNLQLVE